MTPTRKFCHWKDTQEITSLVDSTLMMYLSPQVNEDILYIYNYFIYIYIF